MKVIYSAWLSERLEKSDEFIEISEDMTVRSLMELLANKGTPYSSVFKNTGIIKASVNSKVISLDTIITTESEEIIFFAPIAGG